MNYTNNKSGTFKKGISKTTKHVCAFIVPLYFLSVLISSAIISATNDIYAFYKPQKVEEVIICDSLSTKEFAKLLSERGIISNEAAFRLYVSSKNADSKIHAFEGELSLNSQMSYREILNLLRSSPADE